MDERKRQDKPLDVQPPDSPPRTGRPVKGVGSAVTGPHGVGAPDVTEEDVPAKDPDRETGRDRDRDRKKEE